MPRSRASRYLTSSLLITKAVLLRLPGSWSTLTFLSVQNRGIPSCAGLRATKTERYGEYWIERLPSIIPTEDVVPMINMDFMVWGAFPRTTAWLSIWYERYNRSGQNVSQNGNNPTTINSWASNLEVKQRHQCINIHRSQQQLLQPVSQNTHIQWQASMRASVWSHWCRKRKKGKGKWKDEIDVSFWGHLTDHSRNTAFPCLAFPLFV